MRKNIALNYMLGLFKGTDLIISGLNETILSYVCVTYWQQ